jgi:hypothetical protein
VTVRIDIPQLDPYDPDRTMFENFSLLFEHQRRLSEVLGTILRSLSGSISEPGGLQDVPVAKLAELRAKGPPVVVRVPNEAGGTTLVFNDSIAGVWRRVQDRAVAS